jgi:hypothetical protein
MSVFQLNCKKGHPFVESNKGSSWHCDGRKETTKCKSGDGSYSSVKNMKRWRCDECDFDYCGPCYDNKVFLDRRPSEVNPLYDSSIDHETNNCIQSKRKCLWIGRKDAMIGDFNETFNYNISSFLFLLNDCCYDQYAQGMVLNEIKIPSEILEEWNLRELQVSMVLLQVCMCG